MTICQKIQSLLAAANAKTGENDATLTDAVQTLCGGYGQGGGDSWEIMNAYLNDTLVRFRTMLDYGSSQAWLSPGGKNQTIAHQSIESWEMPNYSGELTVYGYGNMKQLRRFDAGYTTKFDNVCLVACTGLEQIVIRSETVPILHSIAAISGTNADLSIYVRPELIDEYLAATNWSGIASEKFKALYIAETLAEKSSMLAGSTIPNGSMIVCDVDESYTVKGAAA